MSDFENETDAAAPTDAHQERMDEITTAAHMLRLWVQDMRYVLMDMERDLAELEDAPELLAEYDMANMEHEFRQLGWHPVRHLNTLIDLAAGEAAEPTPE